MKILHTSDWHIGRRLFGKKRYAEFDAFLDWLAHTLRRNDVDVLLVAGDVFDTSTPSNRAQEQYYRFLRRVAGSACRHVVIIAGNHDSPSFLNAPRELLKVLDVHVVGNVTEAPEHEVLVLRDARDEPELIVCAVPYLRDRDIRVAEAGESYADKERKLLEGIRAHYAAVAALAQKEKAALGADVPMVAMGHLFAAGGQTIEGDGVRELYVGSLVHISADIFPASFDYVALGHLHVAQKVGGVERIRYSGSPLPMGFGEAGQHKSVCVLEFDGLEPTLQLLDVPRFQELERIEGNWERISERIRELAAAQAQAWLEITYTGEEIITDLRERLDVLMEDAPMEVLRLRNNRVVERALRAEHPAETLDNLDATEVFERCLDAHEVPEQQKPELLRAYQEILTCVYEDDAREQ